MFRNGAFLTTDVPAGSTVIPVDATDDYRGLTTVAGGFNDAWLFLGRMSNTRLQSEAFVHEMAHQWRVNADWHTPPTASTTGGHCDAAFGTRQAMQQAPGLPNRWCTMTVGGNFYDDPQARDGVVGFHYVTVGANPDSEFLRLRRRAEPVPQDDNPFSRDLQ